VDKLTETSITRNGPHSANRFLFREVNERLLELTDRLSPGGDSIDVVCECGSDECVERLTIGRKAYDLIRATPDHFALKPGHAGLTDNVVEQFGAYDVVRTTAPARTAGRLPA